MKKLSLFVIFLMFIAAAAVSAAPETDAQISLIAANTDLWKQDIDYGQWGYAVTDLDRNGRLEIISCSVQGTGFYSYIKAYEVNEDGTGLNDLMADLAERTDSAPDIMTASAHVFFDKEADRYYYVFNDMIRNGMAEYYENKRAVFLAGGSWQETVLASKSTVFSDADHSVVTCRDGSGNEISEDQFDSIAETVYGNLEQSEICLNWQMTDNDEFAGLTPETLTENLNQASDNTCKAQ